MIPCYSELKESLNRKRVEEVIRLCKIDKTSPSRVYKEVGVASRTFRNYIKNDMKCKKIYEEIDWLDVYKPTCCNCSNFLNRSNYKRFRTCPIVPSNFNRKRKCDNCKKIYDTERPHLSFDTALNRIYYRSVRLNKKRFNCNIDFKEPYLKSLLESQNYKCFYTGRTMTFIKNDENKVSLDRLDSSKPYSILNVVICCWFINNMKSDTPHGYFISICNEISNEHS